MEEIKDAEVVEETTLVKPEFKSEIKAEIKGISEIEDNIQEVKDYALKLSKYYSLKQFDEETLKSAKTEKAEVNKFKEKVAEFRKSITKRYNEPLEKFLDEAKSTEKILKETYDNINNQISIYETKQKQEKEETIKAYFYEYCESKNIDFVDYEKANINVTLSASVKSLKEKAKDFVDKVVDDINLINSQQYIDEMMFEYKKDLNVSKAITDVNNRHAELERVQKEKEAKKEQEINDKIMLNKIDECLAAPKIEMPQEESEKELLLIAFEYITDDENELRKIVEVIKNSKGQCRQLNKVGEHYE